MDSTNQNSDYSKKPKNYHNSNKKKHYNQRRKNFNNNKTPYSNKQKYIHQPLQYINPYYDSGNMYLFKVFYQKGIWFSNNHLSTPLFSYYISITYFI